MRGRTPGSWPAILVLVGLLAGACGDGDEPGSSAATSADPADASATELPVDDDPGTALGDASSAERAGDDVAADPATGVPDPLAIDAAPFLPTACPFDVEVDLEVECGVVEAPESRTGLSDDTVELAVAIMRTPAADPEPDPVVYLAGGPGGVALAEHMMWLSGADDVETHPILAERDMILVDQRGTGYSRPSLWCDEEIEDVEDCHERLVDEGVTLEAYSTIENAADIATVRLALGLDEWNLYGSSYGTRLALTVLRDHPDGVRSVVLEGVYPPDVVPAYHDYLPNTLRALDEIAAACADDPECAGSYGDIGDLVVRALEAADSAPDAPVDSIDLMDLTFGSLYGMEGVQDVPYALALAAAGDLDGAIDVFERGAPLDRSAGGTRTRPDVDPTEDAAGVFNSVECREEHAFTDLDHIDKQAELYREAGVDDRLLTALVDTVEYPVLAVCPVWDSGVAGLVERAPAVSHTPVLLLSGRFDPITPPAWGEHAAASLANSTHVVAPTLSHSLVLEDPCIDEITHTFLSEPDTPVDPGCVATMPMPPFTIDDAP
ncbi:MAG: alpha/beta fold hydrolase [Ilumatobacteraceae bacterium]